MATRVEEFWNWRQMLLVASILFKQAELFSDLPDME